MSNEISVNPLCPDAESGFTPEQIKIIKSTIAPGLSDDDLKIFLYHCVRTRLDPFRKQIYAIPRGGRMTIQTSIDGFRLIADRTGAYAPGRPTEYLYSDSGALLGATAFVKKFVAGTWHEIGEQALISEYSNPSPFWKRMPTVMIAKTAESRALRRAFPDDLSGLYTEEEIITPPKPTEFDADDPTISDEAWTKLDSYLNGYDDLRATLKKICQVSDLRNIRESQKDAVNNYVKSYMQKKRGEQ